METHSCSSPSWWLHLSDQSMSVSDFFFPMSVPKITANYQRAKRKSRLQNVTFLLLCVCARALNLTTGHREGSKGVLCCWSPPLPFACLSDVLLGWAPHSDGVDKMTGGGHTPVNVNLAAKHQELWSSRTPEQKRERAVVYKKAGPTELCIHIRRTGSQHDVNYTVPALTQA